MPFSLPCTPIHVVIVCFVFLHVMFSSLCCLCCFFLPSFIMYSSFFFTCYFFWNRFWWYSSSTKMMKICSRQSPCFYFLFIFSISYIHREQRPNVLFHVLPPTDKSDNKILGWLFSSCPWRVDAVVVNTLLLLLLLMFLTVCWCIFIPRFLFCIFMLYAEQ